MQIKAFPALNCPQQTSSFSFCFLPPLNSGGAVRAVFSPFGFRDEHSPAHRTVFQILVTVNLRFHHPVQAARPPSGTTCSRRRMYSYADRRRCRHRPAQCSFHCHSYSTPGVSGCWPASSAPESCGRRNRPACVPAATGIDRVFLSCCPSVVFLLPFSPKRLLVSFLRRVPALACSSALVTVSRSRVTAHFPGRGIPFQTVTRFSRGLSIDELSQVYTFLTSCAVCPGGRNSARKTRYFQTFGIVVY